jgi:hypothetical protein
MEEPMAVLGGLIIACAVGFIAIAALSLMIAKTPAPRRLPGARTSGNPQLRQDPNARFLQDRASCSAWRTWFVGTCLSLPSGGTRTHEGH